MSKYEEFQEWLNQCPIKITEYQDNVTSFAIDFELVDEDAEEVEQCIIDGNEIEEKIEDYEAHKIYQQMIRMSGGF